METPLRTESGSSLACFRTCPKKYYFSYDKKLSSPNYSSSLAYGTLVHAHRAIKHSAFLGSDAILRANAELAQAIDHLKTSHPNDHERIDLDNELARQVIEIWMQYWSADQTSLSERVLGWVDVEKEWSFDIKDEADRVYRHVGKRDGLVFQTEWEKTFLYELKTASATDKESYLYRLHLDHQINSNLLALKKAGQSFSGVIYDIIWKPALRLKTGRKTMPDETQAELNQRILEEVSQNPGEYFTRVLVNRTDERLAEYEQELLEQFESLSSMRIKYRNSSACKNFGSVCQFFDLCMDPEAAEQESYFVTRTKKHPELSNE